MPDPEDTIRADSSEEEKLKERLEALKAAAAAAKARGAKEAWKFLEEEFQRTAKALAGLRKEIKETEAAAAAAKADPKQVREFTAGITESLVGGFKQVRKHLEERIAWLSEEEKARARVSYEKFVQSIEKIFAPPEKAPPALKEIRAAFEKGKIPTLLQTVSSVIGAKELKKLLWQFAESAEKLEKLPKETAAALQGPLQDLTKIFHTLLKQVAWEPGAAPRELAKLVERGKIKGLPRIPRGEFPASEALKYQKSFLADLEETLETAATIREKAIREALKPQAEAMEAFTRLEAPAKLEDLRTLAEELVGHAKELPLLRQAAVEQAKTGEISLSTLESTLSTIEAQKSALTSLRALLEEYFPGFKELFAAQYEALGKEKAPAIERIFKLWPVSRLGGFLKGLFKVAFPGFEAMGKVFARLGVPSFATASTWLWKKIFSAKAKTEEERERLAFEKSLELYFKEPGPLRKILQKIFLPTPRLGKEEKAKYEEYLKLLVEAEKERAAKEVPIVKEGETAETYTEKKYQRGRKRRGVKEAEEKVEEALSKKKAEAEAEKPAEPKKKPAAEPKKKPAAEPKKKAEAEAEKPAEPKKKPAAEPKKKPAAEPKKREKPTEEEVEAEEAAKPKRREQLKPTEEEAAKPKKREQLKPTEEEVEAKEAVEPLVESQAEALSKLCALIREIVKGVCQCVRESTAQLTDELLDLEAREKEETQAEAEKPTKEEGAKEEREQESKAKKEGSLLEKALSGVKNLLGGLRKVGEIPALLGGGLLKAIPSLLGLGAGGAGGLGAALATAAPIALGAVGVGLAGWTAVEGIRALKASAQAKEHEKALKQQQKQWLESIKSRYGEEIARKAAPLIAAGQYQEVRKLLQLPITAPKREEHRVKREIIAPQKPQQMLRTTEKAPAPKVILNQESVVSELRDVKTYLKNLVEVSQAGQKLKERVVDQAARNEKFRDIYGSSSFTETALL